MSILRSGFSYLVGSVREMMSPLPEASSSRTGRKKVLYIEDRVPVDSCGAGYPRSRSIVLALEGLGCEVTLYPLLFPFVKVQKNAESVISDSCGIVPGCGRRRFLPFLRARLSFYDIIIISRPHNMKFFNKVVKKLKDFPGRTKIVYDAEALFARREIARLELSGKEISQDLKSRMLEAELREAEHADLVLAVSEREAETFLSRGTKDVAVLGFSLAATPSHTPFEGRKDLLFVGNLDEDLSPNTDSIIWFIENILPLIRLKAPEMRLHVVGSCRARKIRNFGGSHVLFHGRVENLNPFFESAKVFIAPTRYAAGLPHKVYLAAANGIPVVATETLVRCIGWLPGREILCAPVDDPEAFADRCLQLNSDYRLWHAVRRNAIERIENDCSARIFRKSLSAALDTLE